MPPVTLGVSLRGGLDYRVSERPFFLWAAFAPPAQNPTRATLSGYVREQGSGELLPGVSVYLPGLKTGTTTNKYGFYSLTLPDR